MKNIALIIAAAGKGSRMGANINKQFIELDGQAILAHTLLKFSILEDLGQVLIVHHPDEGQVMDQLVSSLVLPFEVAYVAGGDTRQVSIFNGLKVLKPNIDKVIIHDGARPFVTKDMFDTMKDFLARLDGEEVHGAFFGVPLKDTVKQETEKGFITLNRSALHAVQTPQIFNKDQLIRAHDLSVKEGFSGTDDCSLVERIGGHIVVLLGDYKNIKVTTQEDLIVAEAFLKAY